jgi:hypothetical protein
MSENETLLVDGLYTEAAEAVMSRGALSTSSF